MKKILPALMAFGLLIFHAVPARADTVSTWISLVNHSSETLRIPAPSLGGGRAIVPGSSRGLTADGSCITGTLDGTTQEVTLAPGQCGQWAVLSTGGFSGESGAISFPVGNEIGSITWDYPWACACDNWGWFTFCHPSAKAKLDTPAGSTFGSCPLSLVGGQIGSDCPGTDPDGIDPVNYVFELREAVDKTCTPLVGAPPPPPPPPPPTAPSACLAWPACGNSVGVLCATQSTPLQLQTLDGTVVQGTTAFATTGGSYVYGPSVSGATTATYLVCTPVAGGMSLCNPDPLTVTLNPYPSCDVTTAPPLAVDPTSIDLVPGFPQGIQVSTGGTWAYGPTTGISVEGLPAGVVASVGPIQSVGGQQPWAFVDFSASVSAPASTSLLTVLVSSGGITYSANVTLKVDTKCGTIACGPPGAQCGPVDDGCGGTLACGSCQSGDWCNGGTCQACAPVTCSSQNAQCGSIADGCGGTLSCGTCPAGDTCSANQCVACVPLVCGMAHAQCGAAPDGCGGTLQCGACDPGYRCYQHTCIEKGRGGGGGGCSGTCQ